MQEAQDFKAECDSIASILSAQDDAIFATPTLFKNWTIGDIVRHLHIWNIAADLTLTDPKAFTHFIKTAMGALLTGKSHIEMQSDYFKGKSARETFQDWQAYYPDMTTRFAKANPLDRVKWAGPDMSVKSCIIARQMEHWSHAQAIFDVLGLERENQDRLKHVAHIGVTTYSWSFKVNGQTPLNPKPYVRLTAPSGEIWEWNERQDNNKIEGTATEFCQVVTQCRNIADTNLQMKGNAATSWMEIAQCFAGGAEKPPSKGVRHIQK